MKTRLLTLFLTACLTVSLLPGPALATNTYDSANAPTSGTCGEDITWTLQSGVLILEGTGPMTDYANAYPETGYESSTAPWFPHRAVIHTVTLSEGITTVGLWSFAHCFELTAVQLPETLTSVGAAAFYRCKNLEDIAVPNHVTHIGWAAFYGCQALEAVILPPELASIQAMAFYSCQNLERVTIPENIAYVGENAFDICSDLTTVYYGGTEEDWTALPVGPENDDLLTAEIYWVIPEPLEPTILEKLGSLVRMAFYTMGWIPFLIGFILAMTPKWSAKSTGLLLAVFLPVTALLWGSGRFFSIADPGPFILALWTGCLPAGAVAGAVLRWLVKLVEKLLAPRR